MFKIYSTIEKNKLIASYIRFGEVSDHRNDLSPKEEYLQASARKVKNGTIVKAHKHLPVDRNSDITQEAWIIIKGSVLARFYDLDDVYLQDLTLFKGDMVVFYRGGHSLRVLEEDTVFYEIKTGPYLGVENDKENI